VGADPRSPDRLGIGHPPSRIYRTQHEHSMCTVHRSLSCHTEAAGPPRRVIAHTRKRRGGTDVWALRGQVITRKEAGNVSAFLRGSFLRGSFALDEDDPANTATDHNDDNSTYNSANEI